MIFIYNAILGDPTYCLEIKPFLTSQNSKTSHDLP